MSGNTLKIIACICMLIDHAGLILCDNNTIMRAVGRLAFPIFAYLISEGYFHTSDVRRYLVRLLLFAFISEIPFDLAIHGKSFYFGAQNIFFTLALGLICLAVIDRSIRFESETENGHTSTAVGYFLSTREGAILTVCALGISAEFLRFDYGLVGIITIISMYPLALSRTKGAGKGSGLTAYPVIALILAGIYFVCSGSLQMLAALALIPIAMYNGRRGKRKLKYFFYCFYPLHLLILAAINLIH